ncbi:DUF7289 family protein [Haloprofundus salinisoli]|uniref:DUF7289 family protein n=1 Tax=Haloprofundus salinisoli TaxID=2876193 RepID=UPI001CCDABD1|nr:hypothetical protein [Haloprofundus salinisoli]
MRSRRRGGCASTRRSRAVSETVSFILVFALITSTVGVVYVSGFSGLQDARDAERFTNAERAFDVMADNLADIHHEDAPSRATELKLAESQLLLGQSHSIGVDIEGRDAVDDPGKSYQPILFRTGSGPELVYENGALIRTDASGGSVMLREPDFVSRGTGDDRILVVPMILTNPGDGRSNVGGSTTVLVRAEHAGTERFPDATTSVTLTLDTTTERAPVWERYFESELGRECELTGVAESTVTCSDVPVGRVHVTATYLTVEFE